MPTPSNRFFPRFSFLIACLSASCIACSAAKLAPFAHIEALEIRECSGIVQSRKQDDIYWVHNDSNGGSKLYAIRKNGILASAFDTGLRNVDWEDITTDDSGNLYIGDFGNFENTRRDLVIHKIREPLGNTPPAISERTSFRFAYPEQTRFPPPKRIFDCEALFWANGYLFILTKSLGETSTRLYRFDSLDSDKLNNPTQIGQFDIGPRVTGADASPDGWRLAILTERSVWVFQRPAQSDNYLEGSVKTRSIQAGQCEAICWVSPQELLIANEERALFSVTLDSLIEY